MDAADAKKSLQKQLNSGAGSLVLLAYLAEQNRAMYGYEIAKALENKSGRPLPMKSGALYPVLRSLEKQGLMTSYLEMSDEGRSRKYYKITGAGKKTLPLWVSAWEETKQFVDTVLEPSNENADSKPKRRKRSSPVS